MTNDEREHFVSVINENTEHVKRLGYKIMTHLSYSGFRKSSAYSEVYNLISNLTNEQSTSVYEARMLTFIAMAGAMYSVMSSDGTKHIYENVSKAISDVMKMLRTEDDNVEYE